MGKRMTAVLTMLLVLCMAITAVSATGFADVKESDWFYNDVEYVRENNLMSGISDSEFAPSGKTTRGMIVSVLWRLDGSPAAAGKDFDDVSKSDWYYDAVAWASSNGIVSGYGTTFGPDDNATREQLAAIVYRYASYKKYDVSKEAELDKYTDAGEISEYAVKNLKWANASGLITGTSATEISPKAEVQRAQLAAILKRFCLNVIGESDEQEKPVEDKKEDEKPVEEEPKEEKPSEESKDNDTTGDPTVGDDTTADDNTSSTPVETPVDPSATAIAVDKVSAKPGEEVTVAVKVNNNPGILGMTLILDYDKTMFTLLSAKNGEALEGVLDLTTSKNLADEPKFLWDGVEITPENVKDGTILLLTFKVNDNAKEGAYNIALAGEGIVDNDLNDVNTVIKNGEITISK